MLIATLVSEPVRRPIPDRDLAFGLIGIPIEGITGGLASVYRGQPNDQIHLASRAVAQADQALPSQQDSAPPLPTIAFQYRSVSA